MSAPGAARNVPPLAALLSALGFESAHVPPVVGERASVLAAFATSDTFRWLRRWAVVAVVALVTPISVATAYAEEMPDFHRLAVPMAVAVIVPAWIVELSGVRWPRFGLILATVLPNVWLTLIGHGSSNYLWLLLLVAWVGFAGSLAESLTALGLSAATIGLAVSVGAPWSFWLEWMVGLLTTWFMGLVLRRQVVLVDELRLLRGKAQEVAVLEERQRLARELHDSVTQSLYGISLYAEAAGRALSSGDTEPVLVSLREIRDTTREALGEMRLLLFDLRPALLQEQGLAAALRARLQAVETRSGLVTEFNTSGDERLSPDKEQELYRLAQEALNNVLKHAHAGRVRVRLSMANGHATLDVADDGVGFEPSTQTGDGFGLRGMRERVQHLGGMLHIDSSPGAGTTLHVDVPR